jgi:D-amino-acid dehydrogenase
MRITVIGAGITGVTTAYELATDGHQVTVLESHATVAGGASFANAGLLSPATAAPWSPPGLPGPMLSMLMGRHTPVRMGWAMPWTHPAWLWRWWRSGRPAPYREHRQRLNSLARYSHDRIEHLSERLHLSYERAPGLSVLLRTDRDLARARSNLQLLADLGVPFELLDADQTRLVEPGLHDQTALRGAIRLPRDAVGNCRQFAHLLKAEAEKLGVQFRFRQTVQAIRPGSPVELVVAGQALTCDAVVVCAGADAPSLLGPIGLKLPMLPVWTYTLTIPLRDLDDHAEHGPRGGLVDAAHQVTLTRLGRRIRVSGSAELGGRADHFDTAAVGTLYKVLHDWFPGATHLAQAQRWKGAQAMLADGPPVIGASGQTGVWLNVGHGAHAWTLSAGAARVLSDLLGRRTPAIDVQGLGIQRRA